MATAVEVSNIPYGATQAEVERALHVPQPWLSIAHERGKARIEFGTIQIATSAIAAINRIQMGPRKLRATLIASATSGFVQAEAPRSWPAVDPTAKPTDEQTKQNENDFMKLMDKLPVEGMRPSIEHAVKNATTGNPDVNLKELYLAMGRKCELVFSGVSRQEGPKGTKIERSREDTTDEHLKQFWPLFDGLSDDHRRTGIDGTLHRVSRTIHAVTKKPCAITARVGRVIQGNVLPMLVPPMTAADMHPGTAAHILPGDLAIRALAEFAKRGLLIVGPPNVGKTTVLRELARLLSQGDERVVVVVDKSLEIAGTGVVPHEAIANARVLTVENPSQQHRVMIEAVENQSPDIVIVDELSTKEDCQAARTIVGRGVSVIATVHGESIAQVISDPERSLLVGGVASVTLSAKEAAARADGMRQVSRRYASCVFGAAIELRGFNNWIVHPDLESTVDAYLDYVPFPAHLREKKQDQGSSLIESTPIVGIRQQGSSVGFCYAKLGVGESISMAEGETDFRAVASSGQRIWNEVEPNIFEKVKIVGGGGGGGGFGAAGAGPSFNFGQPTTGFGRPTTGFGRP
jgi:nucleoside-triphosphatase THEP1